MGWLYRIFGLCVASEIPLRGALELNEKQASVDVTIRSGPVPDSLPGSIAPEEGTQAVEGAILFKDPDLGATLIKDGNAIVCESLHPSNSEYASWIAGSAFGAILWQRGLLPLHAGSIEVEGGAVAITGESGAGKSTLLRALAERGFRVVADDVTPITVQDGRLGTFAGFPGLRLWDSSIRELGCHCQPEWRIWATEEKYQFPPQANQLDPALFLPLRKVYCLHFGAESRDLAPLSRLSAFEQILDNCYRPEYVQGLNREANRFKLSSEIARHIPIERLGRTDRFTDLPALVDLLVKDIQSISQASSVLAD